VREQRWFWSSEVDQAVVVSRMPTCMRRHDIKSGVAGSVKMEVFEAGSSLWALKQGKNWYLASTEKCEFQRWTEPPDEPPGRLVGTFSRKNDKLEVHPRRQTRQAHPPGGRVIPRQAAAVSKGRLQSPADQGCVCDRRVLGD
jgi:hypothetical protein